MQELLRMRFWNNTFSRLLNVTPQIFGDDILFTSEMYADNYVLEV